MRATSRVLLAETLELLAVRPGGLWVDGTVGLGGHAAAMLRASAPDGRLLGLDRDGETLARARARLAEFGDARAARAGRLPRDPASGSAASGPTASCSTSASPRVQLDDPERGFSFQAEGPLDMRMDRSRGATAADLVNRMRERELADLIYEYGEEPASRRIARAIVFARERQRDRDHDRARRHRAPRRAAAAAAPASTRRRAPSRRCASASTASSTASARRIERAAALPRARRAHGRDRVPLARGPRGRRRPSAPSRARGFRLLTKKPVRPGEAEVRAQPARAQRAPARRRARGGRGMRDEGVVLLGKPIDNSRVVRQVDPRSRREIWLLILLVARPRRRPRALRLARARDPPRRAGGRRTSTARRSGSSRRTASSASRRPRSRTCGRVETIASQRPRPRRPRARALGGGRGRAARCAPGRDGRGRERAPPRGARRRRAGGAALSQDRPPLVPPALAGEGPTPRERKTRLRLMLLALTISLWALVIGIRLVHLQVLGRDVLRAAGHAPERAHDQPRPAPRAHPRPRGPAARGLGGRGEPLRGARRTSPTRARPPPPSRARSRSTPAGRREVLAQLQKSRAFVWIQRKVDPAHRAARARALQLDGIGFLTEHRRYYPQRELGAHVLGYVGPRQHRHVAGSSTPSRSEIRGRAAKVVVHTDARRRPVAQTERPSTDGATVVLALDEAIQHVAERELERVDGGDAGRRRAWWSWSSPSRARCWPWPAGPTFNPNRYNAYPSSRWRNRAVSDVFEPGSIFKIVTAAAGIQENVVAPGEVLDCGNGRIEIAGTVINDHAVFDQLTFTQAVAKSSDIGMIRVAQRLGRDNFARYVRDFGFGAADRRRAARRVGGPASARPRRWSALSLPSLSFGQEIGVTGAADHDGRGRGRERRLPDEADRGEAGRGRRGARGPGDEAGRRAPRARARDRRHPHRDPAHAW